MPSKRCEAEGCTKWASFNQPGLKRPLYCRPHSQEGMVNVVSRQRCTSDNCPKQANFNHPGESRGLFCKDHIEQGMVDVRHKHCQHSGCPKQATCNAPGSGGGMYCGQHKLEGMVNVVLKRCAHQGCETFPSFGHPGQPGVQYCRLHKMPGMARRTSNTAVRNAEQMDPADRCAHPGCCQIRPAYCISHYQEHENGHGAMGEQMAGEHGHMHGQPQDAHLQYGVDGGLHHMHHHMQQQQAEEEQQQHLAHQSMMESQAQMQHHLHVQMADPGIPTGFSAADIAAWQQGLSHGMTSEPHDAYDQTAMGDPVDEQGQVQYHHQTVTGHPDEGVYKVEVAEINPIHHHNHQEV